MLATPAMPPPFLYASDRLALLTGVGRVRANNEDTCGSVPEGDLFAVADGMGGEPRGEDAATAALHAALCTPRDPALDDEVLLREAIARAHRDVSALGVPVRREYPGAALALARIRPRRGRPGVAVAVAHVGDVRAYLLRGPAGLLQYGETGRRLTTDHRDPVHVNVLVRCLGCGRGKVEPDVTVVRDVVVGDAVLLCSDGLWGEVPAPDELLPQLWQVTGHDPRRFALAAYHAAMRGGGRDNCTLALARIMA